MLLRILENGKPPAGWPPDKVGFGSWISSVGCYDWREIFLLNVSQCVVLDVVRRGEARKQQRSCGKKKKNAATTTAAAAAIATTIATHTTAASRRRKEANFCMSISRDREDEVHKVIAGGFFLLVV